MNILRRRKIGLTLANLLPLAATLKKDGRLDDLTKTEAAVLLANEWAAANPTLSADLTGADWDSIIEFIEALIPLILKLIELFS